MSGFLDKCEEYFDTRDFYEVLKVNRNATSKEIKKAYHKLSLLVHPDRVDDRHKKEATEKFKVLGRIHSILQDENKRKVYDDAGEFDEESDSSFDWMNYWRAIFKGISLTDIQNYEKEYVGSETELRDIKKAYVSSKGDMNVILEMVAFSNCDSEPRIIEIVRKMVDNGEVEEYDKFFKEPKSRKNRRRAKWDAEKAEVESIDIEKLIKEKQQERENNFMEFINNIEEKYGNKNKKRKALDNREATSPSKKRANPRRSTRK